MPQQCSGIDWGGWYEHILVHPNMRRENSGAYTYIYTHMVAHLSLLFLWPLIHRVSLFQKPTRPAQQ